MRRRSRTVTSEDAPPGRPDRIESSRSTGGTTFQSMDLPSSSSRPGLSNAAESPAAVSDPNHRVMRKAVSFSDCRTASAEEKQPSPEQLQPSSVDTKDKAKLTSSDASNQKPSAECSRSKYEAEMGGDQSSQPKIEKQPQVSEKASAQAVPSKPSHSDSSKPEEILDNMDNYLNSPNQSGDNSEGKARAENLDPQLPNLPEATINTNRGGGSNTQASTIPSREDHPDISDMNNPQDEQNPIPASEPVSGVRKTSYNMRALGKKFSSLRGSQTVRVKGSEPGKRLNLFKLPRSFSAGHPQSHGLNPSSHPPDDDEPCSSTVSPKPSLPQQFIKTGDDIIVMGAGIYPSSFQHGELDVHQTSASSRIESDSSAAAHVLPAAPEDDDEITPLSPLRSPRTFSFPSSSLRIYINRKPEVPVDELKVVDFDILRGLIQNSSERCWCFEVEDLACSECVEGIKRQRENAYGQNYAHKLGTRIKTVFKKNNAGCTHDNKIKLFFSRLTQDDIACIKSIALVSEEECAVGLDNLTSAINNIKVHLPGIDQVEYFMHKPGGCEKNVDTEKAKHFLSILRDLQNHVTPTARLELRGEVIHDQYLDASKLVRQRWIQPDRPKKSENKFLGIFGRHH